MKSVRVLSALPCLLLAACQVTTFETPPLTARTGCEPGLVGTWRDHDPDAPDTPAEVVIHIDADCRLAVDEHKDGEVRTGSTTPLRVARHGHYRYAWLDANWLMERFDEEHRFPEGDVVPMRFTLGTDSSVLTVWNTDDKAIAHAVLDGALHGEVAYADSDLFVRLTGEQAPEVLDRDGFFDGEPARFRRVAGD